MDKIETALKNICKHGKTMTEEDALTIVSTLKEKLERENPQPLTLEELNRMDGEPVYVKAEFDACEFEGWVILTAIDDDLFTFNGLGMSFGGKSMNESWVAYRYKPKEESCEMK